MTGPARTCGVLGDPVEHSLSPVLHRAGYAELGLAWEYDAHRVTGGSLAAFLDDLTPRWRGLSLTMPLKREAVDLVDDLTPVARLAGAVNTVVLDEQGRHGDNTDVPGALAALRERTDRPLRSGVVLGGGATATSTGLALADLGVTEVEVVVRSPERAATTVAAIGAHPAAPRVRVGLLEGSAAFEADVVVSTVPAPAQTPELVLRCREVPVVFDVLYDPWPTPLAASVSPAGGGRVLVGGLDLLVHQAAVQFEVFTGCPAPLARMRAAGEAALAARARR